MRDHFDPLAPLLYQNHHHGNHSQMQGQGQVHHHQFQQQPSKAVRSSVHNPFGNGFSTNMAAGFSAVAVAPGSFVGEKRTNSSSNSSSNSAENSNLDCCNLLQSSLKRVRLSRSPGEFRLQRDLETLDAIQWGSSHSSANALNFSATTWIHRATGARLSMVDSLRICLFLPITAVQQQQNSGQQLSNLNSNSNSTTSVNPEQQYQHQLHSYHRDYRWRIMIQIPRMYPHSPPVVTRIDGLSLENIAINELSPMGAQHHRHHHYYPNNNESRKDKRKNHKSSRSSSTSISDGASSVHSTSGVTASESLFYTESQLVRSTSSRTMTSSESQNTTSAPPMVCGSGKTIEWNQWSPITDLGELLDFLLGVAISNLSATTTMNTNTNTNTKAGLWSTATTTATTTSMIRTKGDGFNPSMAVTTARMSSSSSSSLSSVSSASSISSWGNRNSNNSNINSNNHDSNNDRRALSFLHRGGNNTVAEAMMSDENENATTSSNITNVSGASFLSPNRFDVGYGKPSVGHQQQQQQQQQQRTTPFTTNASTTWQQQPPSLHYGGKQGEDDVGMDMS